MDCQSKYMTRFGMLVEFNCKGLSTFMLVEVSNTDVEDIRAMHLESTLGAADAKELFKTLPVVLPMDPTDLLRPATQAEVKVADVDYTKIMKIIDVAALMELPKWNWDQILVFTQQKVKEAV